MMEASFYHLCTSENHSDIFLRDSDFKTAVNLLALCISIFPGLDLYCYEFMSNHMHMLLSGPEDEIDSFFDFYITTLARCYAAEGKSKDLSDLSYKCHRIDSYDHLLNVIVYIHRNGSVVDINESPYTYRWGTGRYYFNPEARARYEIARQKVTAIQRKLFSHSRKFDKVSGLYEVGNCISPMSFCKIEEGEKLFAGAGRYLYMLAKNVESSKSISEEIGERITYNDYELYPVLMKAVSKMYETNDISALSSSQKLRLAKMMHYDYNSNNKQICRMLKLSPPVVNDLFPQYAAKSTIKQ